MTAPTVSRPIPYVRTNAQSAMREAIALQTVANEIHDVFKGRDIPQAAQFLISGLIADLNNIAARKMEDTQ